MEGIGDVEDQLKERIESATGQKVVGVSVCWDFVEHKEDVMELLESQLVEKDAAPHPEPVAERNLRNLRVGLPRWSDPPCFQPWLQRPTRSLRRVRPRPRSVPRHKSVLGMMREIRWPTSRKLTSLAF